MRDLINLVEDADTVTLYRGDSTEIERFQLAKTDEGALFGIGIYLTDDPEIAKDYTVKASGEDIVFPTIKMRRDGGFHDPKALATALIRSFITDDEEFTATVDGLKNEWQNKYYDLNGKIDWSSDHDKAREERDRIQQHIQDGFAAERSKLIRDAVARAKKQYQKIRPGLRLATLTTGEVVFTKPNRPATLSVFKFPTSYIQKCLNVEEPLPDALLPVIKAAFTRAHPDKNPDAQWDLRTYDPETDGEAGGQTFDSFIANYRKNGGRYAWTENWMGGDGKNPSLNFIWNGTHSGYHAFQHDRVKQESLIAELKAAGYVGLSYAGGVRTSGTGNQGGGGHPHTAYVFWNEDDVAAHQVSRDRVKDPKVDDDLAKGVRANKIYW